MKDIVFIARCWDHVREREGEQNAGLRVEGIQRFCGGTKGQSWCCYMAMVWLDLAFSGKSPVHGPGGQRTGSCDEVYQQARKEGWLTETPHVGDLYLFVHPGTEDAHHIGLVTDVGVKDGVPSFQGISGNTSEDGLSSNGNGVYERWMPIKPGKHFFVRYPREAAA